MRRLLTLFTLIAAASCAQTVGDIDRVQPGYVSKAIFSSDHKWYSASTVTHVDTVLSDMIYDGYPAGGDKIRFKVTKEFLIAYRAYENMVLETNGGDRDKALDDEFFGSPIAAFPITSHFDIRRDYNPATGEQSNIIVENTERPWEQRAYMRVDFSKNVAPNYDLFAQLDDFAPVSLVAEDSEGERANPYRLRVDEDVIGVPERYTVQANGSVCAAMHQNYSCPPGQIDIFTSFVRVDPETEYDFVPVNYPDTMPVTDKAGNRVLVDNFGKPCTPESAGECREFRLDVFQRFGQMNTERVTFDRRLGLVEPGRVRLADLWQVWEQAYEREGRQANADGSITFSGAFTKNADGSRKEIPLEHRRVHTNLWYVDTEWPVELMDVAKKIITEWNTVFQDGIRKSYEVEAERTTDKARKQLLLDLAKKPIANVLELRDNACSLTGVKSYLESQGSVKVRAVGKEITLADLVNEHVGAQGLVFGNLEGACSLLEYYTDKRHPERLAGKDAKPLEAPFEFPHHGDLRYNVLNWVPNMQFAGPLGMAWHLADPETGRMFYLSSNAYGAEIDGYAQYGVDMIRLSRGDYDDVGQFVAGQSIVKYMDAIQQKQATSGAANRGLSPEQKLALQKRMLAADPRDTKAALAKNDNGGQLEARARLEKIMTTDLKKYALTPELLDLYSDGRYGKAQGRLAPDELKELEQRALPALLPGLNPALDRTQSRLLPKHATTGQKYNLCVFDDFELGDLLASQVKRFSKEKNPEKIWEALRKDIALTTMIHEVGHNVGLNHNFRGSADALNYDDNYWSGDANDPKKYEQMSSSIMDYGFLFNSDFSGLGKYDRAHVMFAYFGLLEVFDVKRDRIMDPAFPDGHPRAEEVDPVSFLSLGWCSLEKGDCSKDNDSRGWMMNPAKLPAILGGAKNLKARKWVSFTDYVANWRATLTNGSVPPGSVNLGFDTDNPKLAVPYMFCDNLIEGNLLGGTCRMFDHGPTFEEQVQSEADLLDFTYVFSAYRRNRLNWSPNGHLGRLQFSFDNFAEYFRYFYYGDRQWGETVRDMDFYQDLGKASIIGLAKLSETISRPEAGVHCLHAASNTYYPWYYVAAADDCVDTRNPQQPVQMEKLEVPLGVGRPSDVQWSQDYDYQLNRIGTDYEKVVALSSLANSGGVFFRFDAGSQFRLANISYYRLFKDDILNFFGGIMTDGFESFAARATNSGEVIAHPMALDLATKDTQDLFAANSPTIFPATGDFQKNYTLLYGLALMTSTVDGVLDFSNYARVSVKGASDDFEWAAVPAEQKLEVAHPVSGAIYRAKVQTDLSGKPRPELSLGHRLLSKISTYQGIVVSLSRLLDGTPLTAQDVTTLDGFLFGLSQAQPPLSAQEVSDFYTGLSEIVAAVTTGQAVPVNDRTTFVADLFGTTPEDPQLAAAILGLATQLSGDLDGYKRTYIDDFEWAESIREIYDMYKFGIR